MKNYTKCAALACSILGLSSPLLGLESPKPGVFDKRVAFITYNAEDIVKLIGHYGYSTHIRFSDNESIKQIAMGDPGAWDIAPVENHIFIKPVDSDAETNMTVITSHRVYNFELSARWPDTLDSTTDTEMFFQINFKYPHFEKEQELALQGLEEEKKQQEQIETFLNENLSSMDKAYPRNWDYWYKGSEEIKPDLIFDDGRFTYVRFANNREMPAIYTVNEDGTESLVNTNINPAYPDIITIHKVKQKFVFRKGKAVTCIFNKSFDAKGISIPTGTTSESVKRTIKS